MIYLSAKANEAGNACSACLVGMNRPKSCRSLSLPTAGIPSGAPVEGAIESVLAYQELNGLSQDLSIEATIKDHPAIPDADALRAVLAFEAAHEHLLTRDA
jgi:hypothetical protein